MAAPQSFKNHTRWDPLFHFFVQAVMLLNIPLTIWWYVRHFAQHRNIGAWLVLVSVALFMLTVKVRLYALKNQDRMIVIEERARLASVVSGADVVELSSLRTSQLVGLRFASTAELPDLARRAVRENLTCQQIKESIVSWRADNHRI